MKKLLLILIASSTLLMSSHSDYCLDIESRISEKISYLAQLEKDIREMDDSTLKEYKKWILTQGYRYLKMLTSKSKECSSEYS